MSVVRANGAQSDFKESSNCRRCSYAIDCHRSRAACATNCLAGSPTTGLFYTFAGPQGLTLYVVSPSTGIATSTGLSLNVAAANYVPAFAIAPSGAVPPPPQPARARLPRSIAVTAIETAVKREFSPVPNVPTAFVFMSPLR